MMKRIFFVLAAAALGFAGLYYRGLNGKEAQHRADVIVDQDVAGTADLSPSINSLKAYVQAHMGASVNFTLTGAYDRALAQYQAQAQPSQSQIYADAQKACAGKSDSVTQAKCNAQYLQTHLSTAPTPTPQPEPRVSAFTYNLRAPIWTPDLPGALLLGAVVALLFSLGGLMRRRRHR
jgi:hypothetical protein